MNEDYWIYKDKFIFKPDYNDSIDKYVEIIKKYSELIFSDYDNLEICIETNNIYSTKYPIYHRASEFNMPLNDSLNNLTSLTHLIFGIRFNQPLKNSLNNLTSLTHLTFGDYFNQSLTNSLNNLISLTHLTLGWSFNQPLANSLNNLTFLTHLTLGYKFNQQLEIPFNIKFLTLNCNNINLIENLPNSIEELNFGYLFDLELLNLPNSIKIIRFDKKSNYDKDLNNLPKQLEILELPEKYNKEIINVNPNCKIIK